MLPLLLGVHGRVRLPAQTLLAQPAPFRRSAHAHVLASKGEYTLTRWATAAQLRNASEWYYFPGRTGQGRGVRWLSDPTHGYQSATAAAGARGARRRGAGGSEGGFSVRAMVMVNGARLETAEVFNGGLFVVDATGTPGGCSAWAPVAPRDDGGERVAEGAGTAENRSRWPRDGEIDLLELVNRHKRNHGRAHRRPLRRSPHRAQGVRRLPAAVPAAHTVPGKHGSSTRDGRLFQARCADEAVGGLASRPSAPTPPLPIPRTRRARMAAPPSPPSARALRTPSPRRRRNSPLRHSRIANRALSRPLSLAATGEPTDSKPAAGLRAGRRCRCTRKSPPSTRGASAPTAPSARSSARARRCLSPGLGGAHGEDAERDQLALVVACRPAVCRRRRGRRCDRLRLRRPGQLDGRREARRGGVPRRHRLTGGAGGAARTCWYQGEHENITEAEASLWRYKWRPGRT